MTSWLLPWRSLAGALLGAFFFGGLWWTVQKGVASERPALWFLGSLLLRTGIDSGWILFCFAGSLVEVRGVPCLDLSSRASSS